MNVVSAVSNMQQELNYYKETAKEQTAIIKQLTEGPGEIEYIHPLDFHSLLESVGENDTVVDIVKHSGTEENAFFELKANGKKYKISPRIPEKQKPSFIK